MDEEARCAVCRIDGRAACVQNCQWRQLFPVSEVEKVRCLIRNFGKARLSRDYDDTPAAGRAFRFETMHRDALVQEAYRYRGGVAAHIQELENLIQQKDQQIAHLQGQHNVPLAPAAPGIPQQPPHNIPAQAAPGIPQQQQGIPPQAAPGIPQQQQGIPPQAAPGIPQQQQGIPPQAAPGIPQQQQGIPAQAPPGIPQQQQGIPAQAPPGIPQQQQGIPAQALPGIPQQQQGIPQQQQDNPPPQDPQGHNEPQNPQAQNAAHFSIYLGNRRIFSLY